MSADQTVTMSVTELSQLIAAEVAKAIAANASAPAPKKAKKAKAKAAPAKPAPVALSPALKAAIEADEKNPETGYYRCFERVIIARGLRKYGDDAKFDPKTIAKAQKAYGVM